MMEYIAKEKVPNSTRGVDSQANLVDVPLTVGMISKKFVVRELLCIEVYTEDRKTCFECERSCEFVLN
jgi:hypothetical protein